MGIQFYHFDAFSRVESKSKAKSGKSVYSVAGEAERTPGFCDHVKEPRKPVLLYGIPYSEVVTMAEDYAANTFDSVGRAVRKNGFCMIGGVVSAPADMNEKVWKVYKKACLEYLKKTWGDNLKSVIEHLDETFEGDPEHHIKPGTLHRHLHFACVPQAGINFTEIHPGIKAKRAADKAYGVTKIPGGLDERGFEIFKKEGRQAGDRAYKQAMKLVQDEFFTQVGDVYGLLRYGPKRSRLSRDEIIKRDHEKRLKQKRAVELSEQEEKAQAQAMEIQKAEAELDKIQAEKKKHEDSLRKKEKEITEREKTVTEGERKQAAFENGLGTGLKGWKLPEPTIGEFAGHYVKRIAGEVMGIVQRALNTIKEYTRKTKELDTTIREYEKQADLHIAAAEKTAAEQVSKYKAAFEKLRNKVLGIGTVQELTQLQKQLTPKGPQIGR